MKSKKTFHVHDLTADTKRVTVVITINGRGKMLPPMLIFKGAMNGQIMNRDFGTYPDAAP